MAAAFTLWRELTPSVQNQFPQGMDMSPTGDIYTAQTEGRTGKLADIEDMTISRFDETGYVSRMSGLFGHAGNLAVERSGTTDYLRFEYYVSNTSTGKVTDKQWVRIPYTDGRVWTEAEVLAYPSSRPDYPLSIKKTPWFQAYTLPYAGKGYLLYGCPYNNSGPSNGKKGYPGRIDITEGTKVVGSIDISKLGRGADGKPLRGRLEPEGITIFRFNGLAHLVVSIVTGGYASGMRIQMWRMPIETTPGSKPVGGATFLNAGIAPVQYSRPVQPFGQLARWVVCDSISNRIVGSLEPNAYEITDPATAPGYGTLTVPFPGEPEMVTRLQSLTSPQRRWVAALDTGGNVIWAGPIIKRPTRIGPTVSVQVIDWRGWFYRRILSSLDGGKIVRNNVDQATIFRDLLAAALKPITAPAIGLDQPALTGVKKSFTGLDLDLYFGEMLDDLASRDQGAEWFTYAQAQPDGITIRPRVAMSYPERQFRQRPLRINYREGYGGEVFDPQFPEPPEPFTRIHAVGEGERPKMPSAYDTDPDLPRTVYGQPETPLAGPRRILWEQKIGPFSNAKTAKQAFEYAAAEIQKSRRSGGLAEVSVTDAYLPFSSYEAGDRARVDLSDGWNTASAPAARIVQRVLTGGRGRVAAARLTLDMADAHAPFDGVDPGEKLNYDA